VRREHRTEGADPASGATLLVCTKGKVSVAWSMTPLSKIHFLRGSEVECSWYAHTQQHAGVCGTHLDAPDVLKAPIAVELARERWPQPHNNLRGQARSKLQEMSEMERNFFPSRGRREQRQL